MGPIESRAATGCGRLREVPLNGDLICLAVRVRRKRQERILALIQGLISALSAARIFFPKASFLGVSFRNLARWRRRLLPVRNGFRFFRMPAGFLKIDAVSRPPPALPASPRGPDFFLRSSRRYFSALLGRVCTCHQGDMNSFRKQFKTLRSVRRESG